MAKLELLQADYNTLSRTVVLSLDKCIGFYFKLQIICQFIYNFLWQKKDAKHVR